MFKDFIDLSVLKDAQPGFSSQGVIMKCYTHNQGQELLV